jgi:glycosyltransferase involved in cell wall biosynthesis
MPTHDRPIWLEGALKSVLAGAFEDFEIIVSNNGRPEHTRQLRKRIDDGRIRWIERSVCTGPENFLSALSLARGRYVAVLHDDDWWDPRHLATLIPPLEARPDAVVSFGDHWIVTTAGQIDYTATERNTQNSGRATLKAGYRRPFYDLAIAESIPLLACAFRREALAPESFPPEIGTAIDMWVGYQLALTGGAAYVCPDRLVYWRVHQSSNFATDATTNLIAAAEWQRRMLREPQLAPYRDDLAWHLGARRQGIGAALLRQGSRRAARTYLGSALRLRLTAKGLGAWTASWVVPTGLLARM